MKTFRFDKIPELFVQIIQALPVTAEYVVLSLVIGVIFGSLLALAKLGKNRILKNLAYGYTTIMRCVPSVNPEIQIIVAEPDASPVLSGGKPGVHHIKAVSRMGGAHGKKRRIRVGHHLSALRRKHIR